MQSSKSGFLREWRTPILFGSLAFVMLLVVVFVRDVPGRISQGDKGRVAIATLDEVRRPFLEIYAAESLLLRAGYTESVQEALEKGIARGRDLVREFKQELKYKPALLQGAEGLEEVFDAWVEDERTLFAHLARTKAGSHANENDDQVELGLLALTSAGFSQAMESLGDAEGPLHDDIENGARAVNELAVIGGILMAGLIGMVFFLQRSKNNQLRAVVAASKQTEGALYASESRLRSIVESEPECVKTVSKDGSLTDMNPAGLAMIEAESIDQVRGISVYKLVAPEHLPAFRSLHERVFAGESGTLAFEIIGLKGDRRWMETHAVPLRDQEGEVQSHLAVTRDITESKRAEEEVARQIDRLQHLSEIGMTLSGDPVDVFKSAVAMIGQLMDVRVVCLSEIRDDELHFIAVYKDGEVMTNAGQCPLSITPCATVMSSKDLRTYDRVAEKFPEASFLKGNEAFAYCGFPSLDSNGNVVAVTCLLDSEPHTFSETDMDVLRIFGQRIAVEFERQEHQNNQQRIEEALHESEEQVRERNDLLKAAHEVNPDLQFLLDSDGIITDYHARDEADLYESPTNFLGQNMHDVLPAEVGEQFSAAFDTATATSSLVTIEYTLPMQDGERGYEGRVVPLPDHGWVVTVRDITERKRAERELRMREAELAHALRLGAMGAMASGLAHELNQPLSAVSAYADACKSMVGQGNANELVEILDKVAEQAERAGGIIHRVQRFVRKEPIHKSAVDINGLIRETVSLVDAEAKLGGVSISLELPESIPPILADAIQIQQIIVNLVRNACDAMKHVDTGDRKLTIQSGVSGDDEITITVRDNGTGFDDEGSRHLFEPFYTTKSDGMGLGLAVSQSIVEAHGGRLWASPNPDRGVTFHLSLPIAQGAFHAKC